MKILFLILLTFLAGCNGGKVDPASLKPAATRTVDGLTLVLLNKSGDLSQGQNTFYLQFKDAHGQPAKVSGVQLDSSMSMPGMAPMSGDAAIAPTGQPGLYKVTANFAMSGAWHFTLTWNGPSGQGRTSFNDNVR